MSTWKGTADAAAASTGGGGGQKFPAAPRGFYTIQVADFKEGKTKESGRDKVDLMCEVADAGPYLGARCYVTITKIDKGEKGHGIMVHALHAFGLEVDGKYEFEVADLQGRSASALLGVELRQKEKDGRTYYNEVNVVEALYTDKHPQPAEVPTAPEKKDNRAASASPVTSKATGPLAAAAAVFAAKKDKSDVPF